MKSLDERSVFGRNLVRLRKLRNLTQKDLAELSGLSRRAVAYYETEVVDPPASALVVLSNALGVSLEELLSAKKPPVNDMPILLDARTYRKLAPVAELSPQHRLYVYKVIDALVREKKQRFADSRSPTDEETDPPKT